MQDQPYTVISHIGQQHNQENVEALKDLVSRFSLTRPAFDLTHLQTSGWTILRTIATIHPDVLEQFIRELEQFYTQRENVLDLTVTSNQGDHHGDILNL